MYSIAEIFGYMLTFYLFPFALLSYGDSVSGHYNVAEIPHYHKAAKLEAIRSRVIASQDTNTK